MHPTNRSMTISSLGKACNVSAPTIRYYEKIGLLPLAERTAQDQRRYTPDDIKNLTFIRRCRDFGFSIKQTQELAELANSATIGCRASHDLATKRAAAISTKITELRALEISLNELAQKCETNCIDGAGKDCIAFTELRLPD